MKLSTAPDAAKVNTVIDAAEESAVFGMEASPKAYGLLSDTLYSDKVAAVIRELSSNAHDTHVDRYGEDYTLPFDLHLPTEFDPYFRVRDYGTGLDHHHMMNVYPRFFMSDKTETNEQVGAFGLGSKVGFAISDTYTVRAYDGSTVRTYVATKSTEGFPTMSYFGSLPSDEEQGLEVEVPVGPSQIEVFPKKAAAVLIPFPVQPTTNVPVTLPEPLFSGTTADGGKWAVYGKNSGLHAKANVQQGTVIYPVDRSVPLFSYYTDLRLVVSVPIGSVEPVPSREALTTDDRTTTNVVAAIGAASSDLLEVLADEVAGAPTYWDAAKRLNGVRDQFDIPYGTTFYWAGRVVTQHLYLDLKVHNSRARRRNPDTSYTMKLSAVPGSPLTKPFIIERSAIKVPRRKLRRITAHEGATVLHDPSPQTLARIARFYKDNDPATLFVSDHTLPDVYVPSRSNGGRAYTPKPPVTADLRGVYSGATFAHASSIPEDYYYLPVDKAPNSKTLLRVLPEVEGSSKAALQPLEQHYFQTIVRRLDKPVLLLLPSAVKRLDPSPDQHLHVAVQSYVDTLVADIAVTHVDTTLYDETHTNGNVDTIEALQAALGRDLKFGTLPIYPLNTLPEVRNAIDTARADGEALAAELVETYPLVFGDFDTDAAIAIITQTKTQKEG